MFSSSFFIFPFSKARKGRRACVQRGEVQENRKRKKKANDKDSDYTLVVMIKRGESLHDVRRGK